MSSQVNDIKVLIEYLETVATLHNETVGSTVPDLATDIFGESLQSDHDASTTAAIVVETAGGGEHEYKPVIEGIYQFKCYGGAETKAESLALARVLSDRLHGVNGVTTTTGFIISSKVIVRPQIVVEPNTEYIFAMVRYQMQIRGI